MAEQSALIPGWSGTFLFGAQPLAGGPNQATQSAPISGAIQPARSGTAAGALPVQQQQADQLRFGSNPTPVGNTQQAPEGTVIAPDWNDPRWVNRKMLESEPYGNYQAYQDKGMAGRAWFPKLYEKAGGTDELFRKYLAEGYKKSYGFYPEGYQP